jgi:hypothetical protein
MERADLMKGLAGGRLSGGFTLDEAARLYRGSTAGARVVCPECGGLMLGVEGRRPSGAVALLRCPGCGRGVVFDRAPPPDDA